MKIKQFRERLQWLLMRKSFLCFAEMFSSHAHLKRRTPEGGTPRPDYIDHLVEEYYTTTNIGKQIIHIPMTVGSTIPERRGFISGQGLSLQQYPQTFFGNVLQCYKSKSYTVFNMLQAIAFYIPTEAQEQVTANLANFAYDPINWEYLKESSALEVFEECLKNPNERLQLHALAGFCNICLDPASFKFITKSELLGQIIQLLHTSEATDIILNCIALFYQLLSAEICTQEERSLIVNPLLLKAIAKLRYESPDPRVKNFAALFSEDFGSRFEEVLDTKNVLASSKALQKQITDKV